MLNLVIFFLKHYKYFEIILFYIRMKLFLKVMTIIQYFQLSTCQCLIYGILNESHVKIMS